MEPIQRGGCANNGNTAKQFNKAQIVLLGLGGFALWYLLYSLLLPFSHFFAYTLLGLKQGSHLGEAVQFFVYDTPKVMMLLTLIVFAVGMVRSFFTKERARRHLAGRRESVGNVLAPCSALSRHFALARQCRCSSALFRQACRLA